MIDGFFVHQKLWYQNNLRTSCCASDELSCRDTRKTYDPPLPGCVPCCSFLMEVGVLGKLREGWTKKCDHQLKGYPLGAVDRRNPAPIEIYKTLWILRYLPYQLVQDFVHQQYAVWDEWIFLLEQTWKMNQAWMQLVATLLEDILKSAAEAVIETTMYTYTMFFFSAQKMLCGRFEASKYLFFVNGSWCFDMFQLRTPVRKLVQWSCFFSRKKIAGIFFHPKTFRVSWHVVGSGEAPNLTVDEVWNLTMVSFVYSGNSKQPYFHGCLVKQPDFM